MNPNWLGVISVLLALAAFPATYRAAERKPFKSRVLLTVLALIAALPEASFAAYYAHILPEPAWYYQFRSLVGTELLVVFIGDPLRGRQSLTLEELGQRYEFTGFHIRIRSKDNNVGF